MTSKPGWARDPKLDAFIEQQELGEMTHPLITKEPPIIRDRQNVEGRSIKINQPMGFGAAIELVKMGAHVCRWLWQGQQEYITKYVAPVEGAKPMLMMRRGTTDLQQEWVPLSNDLFANDWYLYPLKTD